MTKLNSEKAEILIENEFEEKKKVVVKAFDSSFYVPIKSFETKYPIELIEKILEIKGADYLCDELAREEDPKYVQKDLEFDLKAYFPNEDFSGKRILDFGSGSGASTMILARFFPKAEIVGVELEERLQSIAKERLKFYGYLNVSFELSPSGSELPPNIGKFDLVIFSAVYEHLLPEERKSVMPMIWKSVKAGGSLFLNMTPHRYFPIEHHTTNLPLINYLPDSLAYFAARKFSKRMNPDESWERYLRRGIRGATEGEILNILNKNSDTILIQPKQARLNDRIDLWFAQLDQSKKMFVKNSIKTFLKFLKVTTSIVLVPNLSLVFQKKN